MVNINVECMCRNRFYHALAKISPGLFSPLEPHSEIGKFTLAKISCYTVPYLTSSNIESEWVRKQPQHLNLTCKHYTT